MAEHIQMNEPKIRIWLTPQAAETDGLEDFLGTPTLAYDVEICQPQATVGDYLQALEEFQTQTLADCKGCDGCCHERAPLTIADWQLSGEYQDDDGALAAWLESWAELHFCGPAIDLTLPRTAEGACRFLDQQQKCCTIHSQRSFTCRSHCCLPKTERAEALRAALINAGEDELVRRLLQMADNPSQPWREKLADCRLEDYSANAFSALSPADWRQACLKDLLPAELWTQLTLVK